MKYKNLYILSVLVFLLFIAATTPVLGYHQAKNRCMDPSNSFQINTTEPIDFEEHKNLRYIEVYWCSGESFKRDTINARAYSGHPWFHINRASKEEGIDNEMVGHELSHILGFEHSDRGISNNDFSWDKLKDRNLSNSTKQVAQKYRGFRYIDWDKKDIRYLILEYINGTLDSRHLVWSIKKYRSQKPSTDMYYSMDWNGFGGMKNNSDIGHFYGLPIENT